MSGPFANVNGERIVSGSMVIPEYGAPMGDVVLATSGAIPKDITVTVGALAMVANSFRMASFAGSRSVRFVGGKGGWRTQVAAQHYKSTGGVKASLVAKDAAAAVGETVNVQNDRVLGTMWTRETGPASRVLTQLSRLWWIDPDGTTQLADARPSSPITSVFTVVAWSGAKGRFDIATESVQDWMPGRTFTSPTVTKTQRISMVQLDVDGDGKLRLVVLAKGVDDA